MDNPLFEIQSYLIGLIVFSIIVNFIVILIIKNRRKNDSNKLQVGDRIILIFTITPLCIILFLLIAALFQISPFDQNGDIANWATLVIEIGIGTAIGFSIFVYSNNKQRESDEDIKDVKDISTKLDRIMEDVKKTNDEQSEMIKEVKPIIEKQGIAEHYRRKEVLGGIISNLKIARGSLNHIDTMQKNGFAESNSIKRSMKIIERSCKSIDNYIFANYWWIGEIVIEVDDLGRVMNNYATTESFYDEEFDTLEKITNKIDEVLKEIDDRKKELNM